jgi:hypothetical protein
MSTNKISSFFNFNSLYPLTPTPTLSSGQNYSTFQKNNNSFEFKLPIRTKTMEFYQKDKGVIKNNDLQNKSFTQNELDKSSNEIKIESVPVILEEKYYKKVDVKDSQMRE